MLSCWRHWLYRKKRTNPEILHHNFTLRVSTAVFDSRTLSSTHKLTLAYSVPNVYTHLLRKMFRTIKLTILNNIYTLSLLWVSRLSVPSWNRLCTTQIFSWFTFLRTFILWQHTYITKRNVTFITIAILVSICTGSFHQLLNNNQILHQHFIWPMWPIVQG